MLRLVFWILVGLVSAGYGGWYESQSNAETRRDLYMRQLENDDQVPLAIRNDYFNRRLVWTLGGVGWLCLGGILFSPEISRVRYS